MTATRSRPPRWRRVLRRGLLLGIVLGLAVLVFVVLRLRAEPDYWQAAQARLTQTPTAELEQAAVRFESRTATDWSRPVGDGSPIRDLRFRYDEINAWLSTRLPDYLANQGVSLPPEVGSLLVTQVDGNLAGAAAIDSRVGTQIVTLAVACEPGDAPDDAAAFRLASAKAGKLSIPPETFVAQLRDATPPTETTLIQALDTLAAGQALGPITLPVDPYREATVLNLVTDAEGFTLTVRIEYNDP